MSLYRLIFMPGYKEYRMNTRTESWHVFCNKRENNVKKRMGYAMNTKKFAKVNEQIPGPKAATLLERRQNIVPKGVK